MSKITTAEIREWRDRTKNSPAYRAAPQFTEAHDYVTVLLDRLEAAEKALDKLARLGNEPMYGNSTGNAIARDALAKINPPKEDES